MKSASTGVSGARPAIPAAESFTVSLKSASAGVEGDSRLMVASVAGTRSVPSEKSATAGVVGDNFRMLMVIPEVDVLPAFRRLVSPASMMVEVKISRTVMIWIVVFMALEIIVFCSFYSHMTATDMRCYMPMDEHPVQFDEW